MTLQERFKKAISDALDEMREAMIKYLAADKLITMQGDDIVKHDEPERLN